MVFGFGIWEGIKVLWNGIWDEELYDTLIYNVRLRRVHIYLGLLRLRELIDLASCLERFGSLKSLLAIPQTALMLIPNTQCDTPSSRLSGMLLP